MLINRVRADLPLIQADADQLWRVLSNLISNALNHNPVGIHLTIDAVQQNSQSLYCTIQDSGIGIPIQQQQRLFELYYRGERSRYMPGLGLGLYLCRQIIIAHGGQMGVISQPGSGSIFWFILPIATKLGPIAGQ